MNNTTDKPTYKLLKDLPDGSKPGDEYIPCNGDGYRNKRHIENDSPIIEDIILFTWQVEKNPSWFQLQQPKEEKPQRYFVPPFDFIKIIDRGTHKEYYTQEGVRLCPWDSYERLFEQNQIALERYFDLLQKHEGATPAPENKPPVDIPKSSKVMEQEAEDWVKRNLPQQNKLQGEDKKDTADFVGSRFGDKLILSIQHDIKEVEINGKIYQPENKQAVEDGTAIMPAAMANNLKCMGGGGVIHEFYELKPPVEDKEKDWEILKCNKYGNIHDYLGIGDNDRISNCVTDKCGIHSVLRKSDNATFTVGDKVVETITGKCDGWNIKQFTIKDTRCFAEGVNINNIKKQSETQTTSNASLSCTNTEREKYYPEDVIGCYFAMGGVDDKRMKEYLKIIKE